MLTKSIGCLFKSFKGNLYGIIMMSNDHRMRPKLIENSTDLLICVVGQFSMNLNC